MIGGGPQKITVEIGGQIAASLGRSLKAAQMQVSSFGRNVGRTMNDAALAGRKGFKGILDNALWQQAAAGAATIGIALGASIKTAAKFEAILADVGKTANASDAELKKLSGQILQLSSRNTTNLAPEKLAAGIQDLVAQGLSLPDAVASMESLGRVATATGSDLLDVTKTGFQLQNALKIRPTELKATFDALAFAGKQGAFELKDMAQHMPNIASAAGALGIEGKQGAVALASMMQMIRRDAPDAGQAATRLVDAMLKLKTAPDVAKNFKKFGVDINQVLKDATAKGINPMEAALDQLQRITKGDIAVLGQLVGDKEAKLALMSLMKYRKEYEKLKAEAGGAAAAGTVDKDFERSLKTFQGTLTSFQNSAQRLGIAVGNALLPPLTRIAEVITPAVEGMASWAAASPYMATAITVIGAGLAGLVVLIPIIGAVVAGVMAIGTAISAAAVAFPAIAGIGTVLAVLAGPIALTVAAIIGIGAAILMVADNWAEISTAATRAWWQVKAAWGQFTHWIGGVFNQAVAIIRQWAPKVLSVMFPIPAQIIRLFTGAGIGQKIIQSIIEGLKARAAALFSWISGAVSRIAGMVSAGTPATAPAGTPATAPAGAPAAAPAARPAAAPAAPGRAAGGRVFAGQPYTVGERRRELFVPGMDGAIIPRVARPVAAAGGGVTIHAPVTINAAGGDAMAIRDQVRAAFEDLISRAYGDYRVALND